jgi:hypothetical protein
MGCASRLERVAGARLSAVAIALVYALSPAESVIRPICHSERMRFGCGRWHPRSTPRIDNGRYYKGEREPRYVFTSCIHQDGCSWPGNAGDAQLANAGLAGLFERSFSVDTVKRFKPAAEPYQFVAREMGVPSAQLRMIAAHAWDVLGALRAGWAAAFIGRPGKALFPRGPRPDVVEANLTAAADRIISLDN